jgi:capsular polysaccharide export protein
MNTILLLQGPLGPFYRVLSKALVSRGNRVVKVNFNGGDTQWPIEGTNLDFVESLSMWPNYLQTVLEDHAITHVICYGDCRVYHQQAKVVCKALGVQFWVLEEGYVRPDFITFELNSVNAYSNWYGKQAQMIKSSVSTTRLEPPIGGHFWRRVVYACQYYGQKFRQTTKFKFYHHHRPRSDWAEAKAWLKGGALKIQHQLTDRFLLRQLREQSGPIYFFPLQTIDDFQLKTHSDFESMEQAIEAVVHSFALYAPKGSVLVLKHHPMDRGFIDYRPFLQTLKQRFMLASSVLFFYELNLPQLYPMLRAVVTINSTVGLSALHHGVATKCLGRAIYDYVGLTDPQPLDTFWQAPAAVSMANFERFKQSLIAHTQLNGSFYKQFGMASEAICQRIESAQELEYKNESSQVVYVDVSAQE